MKVMLLTVSALALLGTAAGAQSIAGSPHPDNSQATEPQGEVGATSGAAEVHGAATPLAATAPAAGSQVRIVRLSEARGEVQLDRNINQKFEPAFANVPIVAGERLQTLDGLAEVEFEDNSSLRITPNSLVEFTTLGRAASGATMSAVKLLRGTLYVSMADSKVANGFTVTAGQRTIELASSSHIRLDLAGPSATLAVLQGSATVANGSTTLIASKKQSVSFDLASAASPVVGKQATQTPYDKWDKNAYDYHKVRAAAAFASAAPYAYGLNDLSYYGSFTSMGECGSLWRPYLASAAWNPYQSGVWTMYPGAGYSWVSPYPWGWTPYHSGSWHYCGSSGGWGWQPGGLRGGWNGLNNQAAVRVIHGPGRVVRLPAPLPPGPPRRGEPSSMVPVDLKALPASRMGADQNFVFRGDSAGMGVPRGVFGGLNKISQHAAERGTVSTAISDRQAERGMIAVNRSAVANNGIAPGSPSGSPMGAGGATQGLSSNSRSSTAGSPSMGSGMGGTSAGSHASAGSGGSGHH